MGIMERNFFRLGEGYKRQQEAEEAQAKEGQEKFDSERADEDEGDEVNEVVID